VSLRRFRLSFNTVDADAVAGRDHVDPLHVTRVTGTFDITERIRHPLCPTRVIHDRRLTNLAIDTVFTRPRPVVKLSTPWLSTSPSHGRQRGLA
jgi:hypothetical protein